MCRCGKYKHNTFKSQYFVFSFVLFSYQYVFKARERNAPWNEEGTKFNERIYTALIIDTTGYLAAFPGENQVIIIVKWILINPFDQYDKLME